MTVALGTSKSKFSAAVNTDNDISVSGTVKGGTPYLTAVGSFDVDLAVEVDLHVLMCDDQLPITQLCPLIAQEYMHARFTRSSLTLRKLAKRAATCWCRMQLACWALHAYGPNSCRHCCIDIVCLSEKCRSKANQFLAIFVYSTEMLSCLNSLLDMLLKSEPEADLDA